MLYYSLNKNVYLVDGYVNSCIYDINSLKLYLLNEEARDCLKGVLFSGISETELSEEHAAFLKQLLACNLLKESKQQLNTSMDTIPKKTAKINFAWIEVTTGCNLKCIHCYEEAEFCESSKMSMPDFERVVKQLQDAGIKKIQIIGGEPLILHDNLLEMLEFAYGKFETIELFTNGTLIDKKWIKVFKKYNIKIALSIYSYNEKEHDKVTGVCGSYIMTNKAIQLLNDNEIKYRVCNVLMNGISIGTKNTENYSLNPNKDIVRLTGRASLQLLNRELIQKKLITKEIFTKKLNKSLFKRLQAGHNCFSNKIYIACGLKVYPCVMERRFFHGSIKNNNLNTVIKDEIVSMDKNKVEGCKDCEYRYACFDCRPNTIEENILSKPWYCTYNPYSGEWNDPKNQIKEILSLIDLSLERE